MTRRRSSCCFVLSFRVLGRELSRSCAIDGGGGGDVGVAVVTAIVVCEKLFVLRVLGFSWKWGISRENVVRK